MVGRGAEPREARQAEFILELSGDPSVREHLHHHARGAGEHHHKFCLKKVRIWSYNVAIRSVLIRDEGFEREGGRGKGTFPVRRAVSEANVENRGFLKSEASEIPSLGSDTKRAYILNPQHLI